MAQSQIVPSNPNAATLIGVELFIGSVMWYFYIIRELFIYDLYFYYFPDKCWALNEILEPEIFIFKINTILN